MKILVTGGEGRLGKAFAKFPDVVALPKRLFDVTKPSTWEDYRPEVLINCAAEIDVDGCERNPEAYLLNQVAPAYLAKWTAEKNIKLVHISTDAVFSGDQGPYREQDTAFPLQEYGWQKFRAENYVMTLNPAALVVRTGWLFGPQDPFPSAKPNARCGSPTFAKDLAGGILKLLEVGASGVCHFVNTGPPAYRLPKPKRPADSRLRTELYSSLTGLVPRSWVETESDWGAEA